MSERGHYDVALHGFTKSVRLLKDDRADGNGAVRHQYFSLIGFWLGDVLIRQYPSHNLCFAYSPHFSWLLFWFGGVFVNALVLSANNALILVGAGWRRGGLAHGISGVGFCLFIPVLCGSMHEMREAGQSAEADLNALTGSHDNRQMLDGFCAKVAAMSERHKSRTHTRCRSCGRGGAEQAT